MQVELLSAAPLPGSVKVARRPVKPLVLVRVQVWQPFSGCNVSSRRPCSERGGRRCNSCHPDHFWKAGRYKLAAPVLKTGSARAEVGALPTPSAILAACQHLTATPQPKETYATCNPLPKPVALSQELQTKSCHSDPTGHEAELHFS